MEVLQLLILAVGAIWAIWQTFVTAKIQREVKRLDVKRTQSLARLQEARGLVEKIQKTALAPDVEELKKRVNDPEIYDTHMDYINFDHEMIAHQQISDERQLHTIENTISDWQIELEAMARALGDEKLQEVAQKMRQQPINRNTILEAYQRIFELMDQAIEN